MKTATSALGIVTVLIGIALPTASSDDVRATQPGSNSASRSGTVDSKSKAAESAPAEILIAKARAGMLQLQSQADVAEKEDLRKQARAHLAEAREIVQADHDRYKKAYDAFDKFIDKTDKARYEARDLAFRNYIQAQLYLSVLTYEDAQTHDRGSAENKKLLNEAANSFEQIHARYRQMVAGLYARMWQGKCFEEQDDLLKALGIYNELLQHGGDNIPPALKTLQDRVRLFRLICLNHAQRKDFRLVIDEAQAWLEDNRDLASSKTGLGIQWEMIRALDMLAKRDGNGEAERNKLLQQALTAARVLNHFPGEYKDLSAAMVDRLRADLHLKSFDLK